MALADLCAICVAAAPDFKEKKRMMDQRNREFVNKAATADVLSKVGWPC